MINLPFDKWKLNFYSEELNIAYEDHLNKIRLLSFRILNLFIFIAAVICLITFLIQEQPNILIIMIAGVVGGCLSLLIISKKLESRLKQVFSFYYVWALATNILIAFSGYQVPLFIFGFNTCCLSMGIMQHSDNRLKIVYSIVTPIALLAIFDVFRADSIHFIFQTIASTIFVGIWTYMNEYTSRLAFSLNQIANKQKEIINEFITDGMIAISLQEFSRQFQIEFNNNKFYEIAKCLFVQNSASVKKIDHYEQDIFKYFLRNTYVLNQNNRSEKRLNEKNLIKNQKLEEFCFSKIRENSDFLNYQLQMEKIEIAYGVSGKEQLSILDVQIKKLNFGKPMLLLVVKSISSPLHQEKYQNEIKSYEKLIVNSSQQQILKLIQLHKELKLVKITNNQEINSFTIKLQCLNLQMMNYLQNFIYFFSKQSFCQQYLQLDNDQFWHYLNTLDQYFKSICDIKKLQFEMHKAKYNSFKMKINPKLLTQILINIFNEILQNSIKIKFLILKVVDESPFFFDAKREFPSILETKRRCEESQVESKQLYDQKKITFSFLFDSFEKLDFNHLNTDTDINEFHHNFDEQFIISQVNQKLLGEIGPSEKIFISQQINIESKSIQNIISIQIYQDQSQIEPSYYKVINTNI